MKKFLVTVVFLFAVIISFGQTENSDTSQSGNKKDSIGFVHRDDAKDSITIHFKYLDSTRNLDIDTIINDFYKYYSGLLSLNSSSE